MITYDIFQQDGKVSIGRLLQNSRLPVSDPRRLSQALRNKLAEVAINQMQAETEYCMVNPNWVL